MNEWKPKIVDRRGVAMGGNQYDRALSMIRFIVWHFTLSHASNIVNHENFWKSAYGWDRGGYHAWIDRDGTIYINYDLWRMTWGVANSNDFTCHISLEALNVNDYTAAQIKSRDWLTRKWMKELGLPGTAMRGHYEVYNNTTCPGYTKAELNEFRRQLTKPVSQASTPVLNPSETNYVIARQVIDNKWGNYPERQERLEAAGYSYHDIQVLVERMLTDKLTIEQVAELAIKGEYGNYPERKDNIIALGFNYDQVQAKVEQIIKDNTPKKDNNKGYKFRGQGHVQSKGWIPMEGNRIGTTGLGRRLEAFSLTVEKDGKKVPVFGEVHLQGLGDVDIKTNILGTAGEKRRLEAVKLDIHDDIEYRVHMQLKGWSPWTKNNQWAGSKGKERRIEAIEFRVK